MKRTAVIALVATLCLSALTTAAFAITRNGGPGNDTLHGTSLIDYLYGNGGNDKLYGYGGMDKLYGGAGSDMLSGGADRDILYGDGGYNTMYGGPGNDTLDNKAGSGGLLSAGDGNDYVYANNGRKDTVNCGAGGGDTAFLDPGDAYSSCELRLYP